MDERKLRKKPKRRKTLERSPKLTVLSYNEEDGELECRLELSNKNTVTFKFATQYDKPEEIAESLVGLDNYNIIYIFPLLLSGMGAYKCLASVCLSITPALSLLHFSTNLDKFIPNIQI